MDTYASDSGPVSTVQSRLASCCHVSLVFLNQECFFSLSLVFIFEEQITLRMSLNWSLWGFLEKWFVCSFFVYISALSSLWGWVSVSAPLRLCHLGQHDFPELFAPYVTSTCHFVFSIYFWITQIIPINASSPKRKWKFKQCTSAEGKKF